MSRCLYTYYCQCSNSFKSKIRISPSSVFVQKFFLLEQILNQYKFAVWYIQSEKKVKITRKISGHYRRLHEEIKKVYELYYNYNDELIKEILANGLKTNSKTGENLVLFEDNPRLAHEIMNITEKIRYIANQIIGINS